MTAAVSDSVATTLSLPYVDRLADRYGVPVEDALLIAINLCGISSVHARHRARVSICLASRPEVCWMVIVPLNAQASPFRLEGNALSLAEHLVGTVERVVADEAVGGYFRDGGHAATLNPNARSRCVGCAFCPNTLEAAADPRLAEERELTELLAAMVEQHPRRDLSELLQVTVSTGCFERERAAVDHLIGLREVLGVHGIDARIGFLTSVIRTSEAFEELAERVTPFVLRLTAECFSRRDMLLKASKAALTAREMPKVLQRAMAAGHATSFTYIVGLDSLAILGQGVCESGHWGTVPGTAWALAHAALLAGEAASGQVLVPVLGAGHAGVVQLASAWLSGELATVRPQYSRDGAGLTRLARDFPDVDGLGSEVHPLLAAGAVPGGCLGGALAFSHGLTLNTPGRVAVPIIGDGECETPTTAASWLAAQALEGSAVVPVIHVNGFRMGGRSLLGAMTDAELAGYAAGMGWQSRTVHVLDASGEEHERFRQALLKSVEDTEGGVRTAIFLRCVKGWSGPEKVSDRWVLGTASAHKTPLGRASEDGVQRRQLERWLASYRPAELFDADGCPAGELADALDAAVWHPACLGAPAPALPVSVETRHGGQFGEAVGYVLRAHATAGDFRVFSPDELASNRLGALEGEPWISEVLAEEVLLGWLSGWVASGRRGVLVSYEVFAPLLTAGLIGHLKHRRLAARTAMPSVNLLLTSYGWHNVYTHGDPSLATALLATSDPAVRVLAPADPQRAALALDEALRSSGRVNVVIAGKRATVQQPVETIAEELERGLAIWPHLSDEGEPDLTLVVAGDLPAEVTTAAVPAIRERLSCRVRVVGVLDVTVLGDPQLWPRGLSDPEVSHFLGEHAAVLVITLGHPAAVWGLLAGRLHRPTEVIGWREPRGPLPQAVLAHELGLDQDGLLQAASRLVSQQQASR